MSTAILPLAVTMMAGPQEMTAIIFVTHPNPVKVSLAFLAGVTSAMVLGTTIYYLLAGTVDLGDPSSTGSSGTIIQLVLAGLLALLALRTGQRRLWRPSAAMPHGGSSVLSSSPRSPLRDHSRSPPARS